jgi:hypothetical protein
MTATSTADHAIAEALEILQREFPMLAIKRERWNGVMAITGSHLGDVVVQVKAEKVTKTVMQRFRSSAGLLIGAGVLR